MRKFTYFRVFAYFTVLGLSLTISCKNASRTEDLKPGIVLLEVTTEGSSTVYPPGKTLDIRVYETGLVEFDFYPLPGPDVEFFVEKKAAYIEQPKVAELKRLLSNLAYDAPKEQYGPTKRLVVDATVTVHLTFESGLGRKVIIFKENDSVLHLDRNSEVYPDSLTALFKFVYALGAEVRKPLYNQNRLR